MASAETFQLDCPFTLPIKPMTRRAEPETDTRTALEPAALTATETEPGSKTEDSREVAIRWPQ